MAYFSEDADRPAGRGDLHGGGERRIGSSVHQLRPAEDRSTGERGEERGVRRQVVRVLRQRGEPEVHRADTLAEEEFHGERADRLQQHRERLRVAFGGMLGVLSAEESRDLPEQKGSRARGRYELPGGRDRGQVLRAERRLAHRREREQRGERPVHRRQERDGRFRRVPGRPMVQGGPRHPVSQIGEIVPLRQSRRPSNQELDRRGRRRRAADIPGENVRRDPVRGLSLLRRGPLRSGGDHLRLAGERRPGSDRRAQTGRDLSEVRGSGHQTRIHSQTDRSLRRQDLVETSGIVGPQPRVLSGSPLPHTFGVDQAEEDAVRMTVVHRRRPRTTNGENDSRLSKSVTSRRPGLGCVGAGHDWGPSNACFPHQSLFRAAVSRVFVPHRRFFVVTVHKLVSRSKNFQRK